MNRVFICRDKEQNTLIEVRTLKETENIKYEVIEAPEIEEKEGYTGTYILNAAGELEIKYTKTDLTTKEKKIEESKNSLSKWLQENPLKSTVHNGEEAYYNVTEEKQSLLNQAIMTAQLKISMGIVPQPTWNSTSNICEAWTIEELSQLALEIEAYVKPRIKRQQEYEVQINNCSSKEEVEKIEFDYETIS